MTVVFGLGWLLLSCMGHAELWVLLINRIYALRIRPQVLRRIRLLMDVAVPVWPCVLLWLTGGRPARLPFQASWQDVSPGWRMVFLVTLAGLIPWLAGVLRWQWVRKFQFHRADRRTRLDFARGSERGATPDPVRPVIPQGIRGSRRHPSQWWPWNEIYQLEVNHKTVRVNSEASLSRAVPSTKRIVHVSDLHFIDCPGLDYYRQLVAQIPALQPDLIAFTGDLIDRMDLLPEAIRILQPLTSLAPCVFVLGNHDWRFDDAAIRQALVDSGWVDTAGTTACLDVGGERWLVAGSEVPWLGSNPPAVGAVNATVRLLLSHSPDQLTFARQNGFQLMLSGHTHGGQVVLPVIGPMFAPSLHGVSFAAGLFEWPDFTLHVSRGIGAKDPLRWRCCPELTCLHVQR
jgi:hypothetical protein